MKKKNIIQKIWESHIVHQADGHPAILAIDFMLIHEVTSAQAFETLREKGIAVYNPRRLVATLDHSIPTRKNRLEIYDDAARLQVQTLRENAEKYQVQIFDFESGNQGIVHVIGPELGLTQPGMTIVCGDSHTSTHGAFGALAFGIGTSEVGHVLGTGCLLQREPKTMKVAFEGEFQPGVYAKDAILRLIAEIGVGGANGHVLEFTGSAIAGLSMEERMTICNMSIECGARAGLVSPDSTTFEYLKGRRYISDDSNWDDITAEWESFASDKGCSYDKEITIDVNTLEPMITWGTNPGQAVEITDAIPSLEQLANASRESAEKALEYVGLSAGEIMEGTPVDWAFIGSCTNGRIEDLRIAAKILDGRKVHQDVTLYIVPGSEAVMKQANKEGLDRIFEASGASYRMPGCSMCLGMNDDKVPEGKRCISSSNRNFVGRQGPGSRTHLASPATVVASAIAGKITSSKEYLV